MNWINEPKNKDDKAACVVHGCWSRDPGSCSVDSCIIRACVTKLCVFNWSS